MILDRETVLGVAGPHSAFREIVAQARWALDNKATVGKIADHLVARAQGGIEVLLAHCSTQATSLVTIQNSDIDVRDGLHAWVGDREAFGEYRKRLDEIDDQGEVVGTIRSLEGVIDDPKFSTVGGVPAVVIPSTGGFRYASALKMHSGTLSPPQIPTAEWSPISFGQGAPEGSFTQSILAPISPGIGMRCVYLREAMMGAIHWPERLLAPRVLAGVTQKEFMTRVLDETGIELEGPILG